MPDFFGKRFRSSGPKVTFYQKDWRGGETHLDLGARSAMGIHKVTVGIHDYWIRGKQNDIVRWLYTRQHMKIYVDKAFGSEVWVILRGKSARVSDEFAAAFAGGFTGIGGAATFVTFAGARIAAGTAATLFHDLASNPTDFNLDALLSSCGSDEVEICLSAARGAYSKASVAKDSVVTVRSGTGFMHLGVAIASLKW